MFRCDRSRLWMFWVVSFLLLSLAVGEAQADFVRLLGTSSSESGFGIGIDSSWNASYVTGGTPGDLGGQTNAGNSDIFIWSRGIFTPTPTATPTPTVTPTPTNISTSSPHLPPLRFSSIWGRG